MSNQINNQPDHDKILAMLPWFVNKTLGGSQREVVLNHIEHCDDCQREIQILTSLKDSVQSDAEDKYSMHADVDKDFASVMERIESNNQAADDALTVAPSWRKKLADVFKFATALPFPHRSATVLACVLATVLGFQLFLGQKDNNYSVLSSSDPNNSSMRLSVDITATVNPEQIREKIQHELEKVSELVDLKSDKEGEYIIVFRESVSVTELSNLIDNLENELQIKRVEILP